MFVAGTSTHKIGEVVQTLPGVAPSASTISRLNQTLTQQFETWRERALQTHWRILYLDGVHFCIRHGDQADATIILTALAVDLEGNKEVLALRACAEEDKDGWACLLQDLRARGATQFDLIVTDGHEGLLEAVRKGQRSRLVWMGYFGLLGLFNQRQQVFSSEMACREEQMTAEVDVAEQWRMASEAFSYSL